MADLKTEAQPAVDKLLKADESYLYAQLAVRQRAIKNNPQLSGSFAPAVTEPQGPLDDLQSWGQRFFSQISVQAYGVVCGQGGEDNQDRKDLVDAFGGGIEKAAAVLAAFLVAQLAIAPAIAAVVATIIVKRFFRAGLNATCDVWKGQLPQTGG